MNILNIIEGAIARLPNPLRYLLQPLQDVNNIAKGYFNAAALVADAYCECGVSHYLIGAPPTARDWPRIPLNRWSTLPGTTPSVRVSLSYFDRSSDQFSEARREFRALGTLLVRAEPGSGSRMVEDFLSRFVVDGVAALVPEMARQLLQVRADWGDTGIYIRHNRAMSLATLIADATGREHQLYRIARRVVETGEPTILVFTPGLAIFRLWTLSCKRVIGPNIIVP